MEHIDDKNIKKRKYNSKKRKKIMNKIGKIKNRKSLLEIYKIVKNDLKEKISNNKNGIFFDINKLKDDSIEKILKIIMENESSEMSDSELKFTYTPYKDNITDSINNIGPKLSNKEKNLLKNIKDDKY